MTNHLITALSVSVQYAPTGASTTSNELGIPVGAYQKGREQHQLIKPPRAMGKSSALKAHTVAMTVISRGRAEGIPHFYATIAEHYGPEKFPTISVPPMTAKTRPCSGSVSATASATTSNASKIF